jgi:ribonucleotide monophosphatase NagD (HAD superfamily)
MGARDVQLVGPPQTPLSPLFLSGKDSPMPGQLARRYSSMGARDVRLVGKPHKLIYEACRRQPGVPASAKLLGIGDSLPHDILGAHNAGIDSAFVCSGVHYKELGVAQAGDQIPEGGKLAELLAAFGRESGCAPTHVLSAFRL